jgi:chromosome segregation protein
MYLKNLTVLGFKSFADKTSLNFQPGVTAIVGPNGCGKSNVSDAIRWVLGEQSAKALRGGEMADVIFNGTDARKPLGMAEVSLMIGDIDEAHLKAAGVEVAFNEATVTRRIFRDGGSEYFINKVPCRLKDIQQLFMGTGMGRASYSIMAQGNITQLLSSKPEDRRLVFEEAAGITKFKSQKKEALRKLEYTEQNLLRVADLIREVKRQIGSLQRQAGKARRYKQLAHELQHLDTQLARHNFDVLQTQIAERTATGARIRAEIEGCSEGVLRAEDEIHQLRQRLSELETQISHSQQQGLELKGQVEKHEGRIQFNHERVKELESQNGRALAEISQAEERRQAAEQEFAALTERLAAAQAKLEEHRAHLAAKREAVQMIESQLAGMAEQLRQVQSRAFSAAQQLSRVRNEVNALDLQKQGNIVRLEKLSSEKIQLEEERVRLEARLSEFAANVEAARVNVQTQRGTVEQRQQRLREIQQQLSQVTQDLDALLRQQAEKRSRLGVLEQLQESHEGYSSGALAALRQSRAVLGSLADRIRVPDRYVVAIENALGHNLQLVLTEKPESAQEILAELAASKKGRASIAALDIQCPESQQLDFGGPLSPEATQQETPAPSAPQAPPEVHALSVIGADPSVDRLLKGLLGRTFIVPDLAAATASIQNGHAGCDFVTFGGDLLTRFGVYTGGYLNGHGNGQGPSSILGRKNQIADLQAHLARLQEQVNEVSRAKGALQSEQTGLQAGLEEARSELREQEVAIATHEGEVRALQNSQRMLHQKIDTVVFEIQSLADQEEAGLQKRSALAAQLQELEQQERELQSQLAELNRGQEEHRQERDAANTALTEAKVALATEEQLAASFGRQQAPLEQRIRELGQAVYQRRNEIAIFLERKQQAEAEVAESQQQIERLNHARAQVNTRTAELTSEKEQLAGDVVGREDALRDQRSRLASLQQQRGSIEVELAQQNMASQNLRERIQQKYQLNLDNVRSECITITFADEGPPKVQTLTPEEMSSAGLSTDWSVVAEQVEALQKRLDEMGPVNLVAIEEYEETEQRYQFLSKQHEDLVQAKTQLIEVINRINTQTREMFTSTFNQIRDNFRAMFTEVFGGGKADLMLVDEQDVLESGIEIMARPPGKQLQSISLLSGGEQTMTAVSLLFSIYQVKPSPFCVLDELDAPLDESNINRFIKILQRFLANSQFIIITHNKRTIGMADVLYGVTMQEQGVSRIVSVKFHKTDDAFTPGSGRPLVDVPGRDVEKDEDAPHKREDTLEVTRAG